MSSNNVEISIVVPTYNESQNITQILKLIGENLPKNVPVETIIVDDNSPDGTGKLVKEFGKSNNSDYNQTRLLERKKKSGLGSAILYGIQNANGKNVVIMDSDFSHPPKIIPKLIEELNQPQCDMVIASRYVDGGGIEGWTLKRKLISKFATKIAQKGLGITASDPMSGYFAFKKKIIEGLDLDAIGFKLLVEMLVKTKNIQVKEIPYTFSNRYAGSSKLDNKAVIEYIRSVIRLYRYGKSLDPPEQRHSVRFLSKGARFSTVGAFGLLINYFASLLFSDVLLDFWYLHANVIGITLSIISNFILNKVWTFEDKNFNFIRTLKQFGKFVGISSMAAIVQIGLVFLFVDTYQINYPVALVIAVIIAAGGNFIFNKKITFKEKVWG